MVKKNSISIIAFLYGIFIPSLTLAAEIKCNTAQMQAMDKITGHVSIIEVPVNSEVKFGSFSIVVRDCQTRSPEETPENFAFVDVVDYPFKEEPVNIFKGWMLSSNPAINPVEHPIYDVWLLKCINKKIDEETILSPEDLAKRDNIKSVDKTVDAPEMIIEKINIDEEIKPVSEDNVRMTDDNFIEFPISEYDSDDENTEFSF